MVNTDEDEAHLGLQMLSKAQDLEHGMSSLMMDVILDALESGSAHSSRPILPESDGRKVQVRSECRKDERGTALNRVYIQYYGAMSIVFTKHRVGVFGREQVVG